MLSTIFETNFQKRSVPFDFVPEFPEILVKWIAPSVKVNFRPKISLARKYRIVLAGSPWVSEDGVHSATRHNIHMYPYFLFAPIHHLNRLCPTP